MRRVILGSFLLSSVFACHTLHHKQGDDGLSGTLGIVVGNGSGDFIRDPIDWPESQRLSQVMERLRPFEPNLVNTIYDEAIVQKQVKAWVVLKLDQPANGPTAYEKCNLASGDGEEVRAAYRANTITFCRLFFYKGPEFVSDTTTNFRVSTIMHELMHHAYAVTNTHSEDEEGEIQMMESYFRRMEAAPDDGKFADAAASLHELIANFIPVLDSSAQNLTSLKVKEILWQNSPLVQPYMNFVVNSPGFEAFRGGYHFFVNVDLHDSQNPSKDMSHFREHATTNFQLIAENHPTVNAWMYGGDQTDSNQSLYAQAVYINPEEKAKMVAGVSYKLVPLNPEQFPNQWLIPDSIRVVMP